MDGARAADGESGEEQDQDPASRGSANELKGKTPNKFIKTCWNR